MEYSKLLDLATDLGYELAMSGAETFRVEESVYRMLKAYDIDAEVFVIPNCMHISIEPIPNRPLTRMRRIGEHGNDLDAVERFSGLSRRICAEHPAPEIAARWLAETRQQRKFYSRPVLLAGHFLGAAGFSILFGGTLADFLCSGICGILIGLMDLFMARHGANQFFRIIASAFAASLPAYGFSALGVCPNPDAAIIGALMILVPGLLFTNAMRDIIFGDTNSGMNRIIQVLLIAVAIALGTAAAWSAASSLWGTTVSIPDITYGLLIQCVAAAVGCIGFSVIFNIHGPGGLLCVLGGVLTWAVYALVLRLTGNDITGYFWATLVAAAYSEFMARIRKYPAISYLVVSIFPLIPGAGIYYTVNFAVQGDMTMMSTRGMHTLSIAGVMAVGIILVSTLVRLLTSWIRNRRR